VDAWTPGGRLPIPRQAETEESRGLLNRARNCLAQILGLREKAGASTVAPDEAGFLAGATDLAGGNPGEAIRALATAEENPSLRTEAHFYQGVASYLGGDFGGAVRHFKACRGVVFGPPGRDGLGRALYQQGLDAMGRRADPSELFREAEKHLRRALTEDPQRSGVRAALAALLAAGADWEAAQGRDPDDRLAAAIQEAGGALQGDSRQLTALVVRGHSRLRVAQRRTRTRGDALGPIDGALKDLDDALLGCPGLPAALFLRAEARAFRASLREGAGGDATVDNGGAISDYTTLLEGLRDHPGALMGRAGCYAARARRTKSREDFDAAERDFNACLGRTPRDAHALRGRGLARYGMGRFREAAQDWEAAFALRPDLRKGFETLYDEARRQAVVRR
jgi:tetratricopeptide (TPR) repeat protein